MESFPYKSFRQGQHEAISQANEAFARGKRFVIIEAPTGSGKSAIAVTFAREAVSSYILTAQKILQEQYLRDFPDLALMKGRSNYPCLVAPTHAAAAPCIAGRKFPECDDCPYFVQKDIAMSANNALMNYAYYLAELNYSGGFSPRELLILDEAHNAEASLMNFIEVTLSDSLLSRVGISERLPSVIEPLDFFDFAEDIIPSIKKRSQTIDYQIKKGVISGELALAEMKHKQWCDNQLGKLDLLRYSREEEQVHWVVAHSRNQEGQRISFKPVNVAAFAEDLLFSYGERVLMLSATILDPPTYLRSLGIRPEEAEGDPGGFTLPR